MLYCINIFTEVKNGFHLTSGSELTFLVLMNLYIYACTVLRPVVFVQARFNQLFSNRPALRRVPPPLLPSFGPFVVDCRCSSSRSLSPLGTPSLQVAAVSFLSSSPSLFVVIVGICCWRDMGYINAGRQ
jgi:hypothetical protein